MAARGDSFFNPVTRTRMVFVSVPVDNGGRELVIDWFVPPGEQLIGKAHYHVAPEGLTVERFDVLAGTATCRIGNLTRTASASGRFEIPANTIHVHPRNIGTDELHVRQSIRFGEPNLKLLVGAERFFETLMALSQQGKVSRNGDFATFLQSALTINHTLLDPTFLPITPPGIQKLFFAAAAGIARRLGYEAVHHPVPETASARSQ